MQSFIIIHNVNREFILIFNTLLSIVIKIGLKKIKFVTKSTKFMNNNTYFTYFIKSIRILTYLA